MDKKRLLPQEHKVLKLHKDDVQMALKSPTMRLVQRRLVNTGFLWQPGPESFSISDEGLLYLHDHEYDRKW